ncbi:unnamed protein product, partial [Darwinula stevensoni]
MSSPTRRMPTSGTRMRGQRSKVNGEGEGSSSDTDSEKKGLDNALGRKKYDYGKGRLVIASQTTNRRARMKLGLEERREKRKTGDSDLARTYHMIISQID